MYTYERHCGLSRDIWALGIIAQLLATDEQPFITGEYDPESHKQSVLEGRNQEYEWFSDGIENDLVQRII